LGIVCLLAWTRVHCRLLDCTENMCSLKNFDQQDCLTGRLLVFNLLGSQIFNVFPFRATLDRSRSHLEWMSQNCTSVRAASGYGSVWSMQSVCHCRCRWFEAGVVWAGSVQNFAVGDGEMWDECWWWWTDHADELDGWSHRPVAHRRSPYVIHRMKWCHSNLWSQYDLYVVRQHGVLCKVKWWRSVALFE